MTEDESIMAENIGELREKLARKHKELQIASHAASTERYNRFFEKTWIGIITFIIALGFLASTGYPLYMYITSPPINTHCEIKKSLSSCTFKLSGVRPWQKDVVLGEFSSIEEALEAAKTLKCEVKTQESF